MISGTVSHATCQVALLVSAWIEILLFVDVSQQRHVALLVSAWIEMGSLVMTCFQRNVALLVSAWIEITFS